MIIGMGTVFLTLLLLSILLRLSGTLFHKKSGSKKEIIKQTGGQRKQVLNNEIKAVVVGALKAYLEQKNERYRIISIRRSNNYHRPGYRRGES
ncbi:MAG: OadG family transporter subunit [Bacillota bacterium]